MTNDRLLIVTGTFDPHDCGKASHFGNIIFQQFIQVFDSDVTFINGGNISSLETISRSISDFSIILWMPHVNVVGDILLPLFKSLNKKAFLIQAKRNDKSELTNFQIVEGMFKIHSNLCIVISKKEKYSFELLDPLGNLWYSGDSVADMARKAALFSRYVSKLSRISSKPGFVSEDVTVDGSFLEVVHYYGWRFSVLVKEAISEGRFLGNASTRCMHGFPSMRKNSTILVSSRNVSKKNIESKHFVPVTFEDGEVKFSGILKPSIDTPIQLKLYEYYTKVNYIIHGHTYVTGAPKTLKYIPCGCIEEFEEIVKIFPDEDSSNFSVNLIGHGCLILAKDLDYFAGIGLEYRPFPENQEDQMMDLIS